MANLDSAMLVNIGLKYCKNKELTLTYVRSLYPSGIHFKFILPSGPKLSNNNRYKYIHLFDFIHVNFGNMHAKNSS